MANIVIAYDNRADAGTYSGGVWSTGLPLANLKGYDPKHVARSDDASEASTTFVVDLGYPAPIGAAVLINDNLTDEATLRLRAGPNADGSSALIDVTLTAGDFGTDRPPAGRAIFHLTADIVYARYVLWEISDESNPAGYVQLGRHIVGPVFQPALNYVVDAQIAFVDETRLSRSVDGTQYADRKPKRRRFAGAFDMLTDEESFGQIYDLQKLCGLTVPMFVVRNPSLTGNELQRSSLYGDLTVIDPLVIAHAASDGNLSSWQFVVEERN